MIRKALILLIFASFLLSSGMVLAVADQQVVFPEASDFDDFDRWLENWTENAIEADFLEMVQEVSIEAAAAVLAGAETSVSFSPLAYYFQLAALREASGDKANRLSEHLKTSHIQDVHEQSSNLYRLVYSDNEVGRQKIANAFWLNEDSAASFHSELSGTLAADLYTDSKVAAFGAPMADTLMNEWIFEQSGGQIDATVETKSDDRLSFISTFQFYDEWIDSCNPEEITGGPFYLSDGRTEDTSYLHKRVFSPLHRSPEGFFRSELQLKNDNHMVIVLPDEGIAIDDLVGQGETLLSTLEDGDTTYAELAWQIPTFSLTTNLDLEDATRRLGLGDVFSEDADFSSLLDQRVPLSELRQFSSISISEHGVSTESFLPIPT